MAKYQLMDEDLGDALSAVGPRLRELRHRRETTLTALAETTGISVSTLSRLESGRRKPTLELLLPLARAYGVIGVRRQTPERQTHEGYEWLYVLDGRLRLLLGDQDIVLRPGEAAEFDTWVAHWFGSAGEEPVEVLSLFGRQGERAHLRARSDSA
jgi:transcriptional regulator with XRE-family HTH domain